MMTGDVEIGVSNCVIIIAVEVRLARDSDNILDVGLYEIRSALVTVGTVSVGCRVNGRWMSIV